MEAVRAHSARRAIWAGDRMGVSVCDGLFGSKSPSETKSLPKADENPPEEPRKGEDDPSFSWPETGGLPIDVDGMDGVFDPDPEETFRATLDELKLRPRLFPENTFAVALDDGTVTTPEDDSGLDEMLLLLVVVLTVAGHVVVVEIRDG